MTETTMPLVVDFIGPFVVCFGESSVKIHAPMCTDHNANILTDSNDFSLFGATVAPAVNGTTPKGFVYQLAGPSSNAGKCNCLQPDSLLLMTGKVGPVPAYKCHLVLEVPRPNTMVPLTPEQIWMHKNGSAVWVNANKQDIVDGSRARGLRFVYADCPTQPTIQNLEHPDGQPVPDMSSLNANALGLEPPHYHLNLRFSSNSTVPDEDHEDAYNCFQQMRTLIPGSGAWRVDFSDTPGGQFQPRHHGGTHPVDCGAAVLVAPDPA